MELREILIAYFSILLTYLAFIIVGQISPDTLEGVEGGKRLYNIIDNTTEIYDLNSGIYDEIYGDIIFKDVSFSYKNRNALVIKSVSFEIPKNMKLGITGSTGSGKSTIAQLLLRFYDPTSGEILLDGKNINLFNLGKLRESICWVGQEPLLFKGSILFNLQLSKKDVSDEDAMESLRVAQVSSIIDEYGIDYDVGLRGCKLSGGQKQRICIARALIRNPKILVLDESTSALDNATEKKLMDAISVKNFSIVSIAHRLESIKNFDIIILLEDGMIVNSGKYSELKLSS